MALVVQKFGGTSVATADRIEAAARKAMLARKAGKQVVMVVSARGKTTDELIQLASQIHPDPPAREMDMLLSTGEQISIALMAMALDRTGFPAVSFTGAQIGIVTDKTHTKARIKSIKTERMRQALEDGRIVIVAGFQGIDEHGNITTLGRGGSDTTAVALAAVLKHDRNEFRSTSCEIYTDVDGIYTTDPRVVPEARKIDFISYDEMLELASVGAGVMHSRSIEFAKKFDVPIHVRSSFSDADGTWIIPEADWMSEVPVCGAALVRDEARINLEDLPDIPGISHRIFSSLAEQNIVVDMIVQNAGSGAKASLGFTVLRGELHKAVAVLHPLAIELGANPVYEDNVSKVSVVGTGMRTHTGVAQRMFSALAEAGINMKMITTSDIKISVLVERNEADQALRVVHNAFGLNEPSDGMNAKNRQFDPMQLAGNTSEGPERDLERMSKLLSSMEGEIVVSRVDMDTGQGRITIDRLPDKPGLCANVFQAIADGGIIVDMILQNLTGPGQAQISFSVPLQNLDRAHQLTQDAIRNIDQDIAVDKDPNIATMNVLGVGMRTHTGVARKMFGALAEKGINISMINTSEVRVSVVVKRDRGEKALACLKEAFEVG